METGAQHDPARGEKNIESHVHKREIKGSYEREKREKKMGKKWRMKSEKGWEEKEKEKKKDEQAIWIKTQEEESNILHRSS